MRCDRVLLNYGSNSSSGHVWDADSVGYEHTKFRPHNVHNIQSLSHFFLGGGVNFIDVIFFPLVHIKTIQKLFIRVAKASQELTFETNYFIKSFKIHNKRLLSCDCERTFLSHKVLLFDTRRHTALQINNKMF